MHFCKTLDEDQINLLKCAGVIILLTSVAASFTTDFGTLGFVLLLNRIVCSIFWRFKNKSRFKRRKYICELRNKRIDQIHGKIFSLINLGLFVAINITSANFDLDSGLAFFLCISITFFASYFYQFYIKAPIGTFYASDPNETISKRDPFEKSSFDLNPGRYDPLQNYNPMNIYYDSRD
jgi:hypothetical protein